MKFSTIVIAALTIVTATALPGRVDLGLYRDEPSAVVNSPTAVEMVRRDLQAYPTISVTMGNSVEHTGQYHGHELFDKIHECLEKLCPDDGDKGGHDKCLMGFGKYCPIEGVEYQDQHHKVALAFLEVSIREANFGKGFVGIRKSLFEAVAGVFMQQTMEPKNSHDKDLEGGAPKWFSIGRTVKVVVDNSWDGGNGLLDVQVNFNGKTTEGSFDCSAVQARVKQFIIDNCVTDFAEALHFKPRVLRKKVWCPDTTVTGWPPKTLTGRRITFEDKPGKSLVRKDTKITTSVRIGNEREHIGVLVGPELYSEVKRSIKIQCDMHWGKEPCDLAYPVPIRGIVYNAKGHRATNAYMIVEVRTGRFPEAWHYPVLTDAVSLAVQAMSEDKKNCYHVKLDGQDTEMCNIGNYVQASITDNESVNGALEVSFRFNGKTLEGQFDCVAIQEKTVEYIRNNQYNSPHSNRFETVWAKCPNITVTGSSAWMGDGSIDNGEALLGPPSMAIVH